MTGARSHCLVTYVSLSSTTLTLPSIAKLFSGTVEAYHEVWWFYCSTDSSTADRYVVYNYLDNIWYYGTMDRTAWLDSGLRDFPLAATYNNNLVNQEEGVDNNELGDSTAIHAYASTAEFDLDDGHQFNFIWRVLPDITFDGSTAANPSAVMTLLPMQNSGSGYNSPASVGGSNDGTIARSAVLPIEKFYRTAQYSGTWAADGDEDRVYRVRCDMAVRLPKAGYAT